MIYTWPQLFKQLFRAYLAKKIDEVYAEGLKNADTLIERRSRGGL